MADTNRFAGVEKLITGSLPSWIGDGQEQRRVASYQLYEDIYWNVPNAFKLMQRGPDSKPIYVPVPKTIVETLHRYLASDLSMIIDPLFANPEDAGQLEAFNYLTDLLRRERFASRFNANKRFGIIRGDWAFAFYANDELPEGSRISIQPVHPGTLFKITEPGNVDNVIGYDIARVETVDKETRVRRLRYIKETKVAGPSKILVSEGLFEVDKWGGPGMEEANPETVTIAQFALPDEIDSLPIYHIKNFDEPHSVWGSSELRGLEMIISSVNQSITDEDLALALEGLGAYVTDAGQPINEAGEPEPWNLGPGRVVELPPETYMKRLEGIGSVAPMQDHLKYLHDQIDSAAAQPDVARGTVDVDVAESGVALAIRFGPLLARANEKELGITDVLANMLYDLNKWVKAYEGSSILDEVRFMPKYGEKLPPNKQKTFDNVMAMLQAKVIDSSTARSMLRELGYKIPDDTTVMDGLLFEAESTARVQADAMGVRLDAELGAGDDAAPDVEAEA